VNIGNYKLSAIEENKVLTIYEKLKHSFPNIRFDYRKEITGIGEEGRHLLCYFSLKDNTVYVKFKNRTFINLDDFKTIQNDIEATVELFKSESFNTKRISNIQRTNNNSPQENHLGDGYSHMQEYFLLFEKAKELIPEEKTSVCFNSCSNRLKKVLYQNHIFRVEDLILLTPIQIMNIPNLGRKCFIELCDFLLNLTNDEIIIQNINTPSLQISEEKLQKIQYIRDNKRNIIIDYNDRLIEFDKNIEIYNTLYFDLINHVYETATIKLKPRERTIILSRFGIGERAKTLQEIGEVHSITRERVRQLIVKATRKMGHNRTTTDTLLDLEYRKVNIVSKIDELSPSRFLSFLFIQEASFWLIEFICKHYFHSEIDVSSFRHELFYEIYQKKQQEIKAEKFRSHNDNIYQFIVFPNKKRCISQNDFSRLKTERIVNREENELKYYTFNENTYQCESYLEQRMLNRFLINQTFKSIKTQSLKIPFKDTFYYPDFQCLTHDDCLVIVEIKPLLHMCEYVNIEKFKALKEYCQKYGFGYLIIDERGNSFEHINEENINFSESVLSEINQHDHIAYHQYKHIFSQTNATTKNLLALIKKHKLHFSFPFLLEK